MRLLLLLRSRCLVAECRRARWQFRSGVDHTFSVRKIQKPAFPLPPLAEQTRIVAEVERRLSVVEELEAVVSANLQRASRLRQSILQKAFDNSDELA